MHPKVTEGSVLFSVIAGKGKRQKTSYLLTFNLPFKINIKELTNCEQVLKKDGLFKQPD